MKHYTDANMKCHPFGKRFNRAEIILFASVAFPPLCNSARARNLHTPNPPKCLNVSRGFLPASPLTTRFDKTWD